MKKLAKRNHSQKYTIEAYSCWCSCICAVCHCAVIDFLSINSDHSTHGHGQNSQPQGQVASK